MSIPERIEFLTYIGYTFFYFEIVATEFFNPDSTGGRAAYCVYLRNGLTAT